MNILLLEDRGSTAHFLLRWLKENGHLVLGRMKQGAFNLNDANSIWSQRKEVPVHCIIIDLDVPKDGLSPEQEAELDQMANDASIRLAGWIWLRDEVLQNEPEMRSRTIIYSDYIAVLLEHISEEEYRGISVISKRGRGTSVHAITAKIEQIEKEVQAFEAARKAKTEG